MSARKFKLNDTVDFVVVGSGAAGGVMARELSQAGFEVLVLEQGRLVEEGAFDALATAGRVLPKLLA